MEFDVVDLDHVAIRVSDMDASLEFYHDIVGLPLRDQEKHQAGELPFVSLVAGGRHIHLFPSSAPIEVGTEHVCLLFRSDDTSTRAAAETARDELAAKGVEIEPDEPAERLGAYGRDWAIYVRDPDDRIVELKFH